MRKIEELYSWFIQGNMQKKLVFFASIVITLLLIILNWIYPLVEDDWTYSFIFDEPIWLTSVWEIFPSQYTHYMTWGGRAVAHCIAQFLILIGHDWAAIIKGISGVLLVYFMYKIANRNMAKHNITLFMLSGFLTWYFIPTLGGTFWWTTGAANYLFTTLIVLCFMYVYYNHLWRPTNSKDDILKITLFFLFGIVAGWTNENLGLVLVIFTIIMLFWYWKEKIKIKRWMISGLVGSIIGAVFVIIAPGNFRRLRLHYLEVQKIELPFLEEYARRFEVMMRHFNNYMILILTAYFVALAIYYLQNRKNITKDVKKVLLASVLFFVIAAAAFLIMIGSAEFPDRALPGSIILFIVSIGILFENIRFENTVGKSLNVLLLLGIVVYMSFQYSHVYKSLNAFAKRWEFRETYIADEKSKGNLDIVLPHDNARIKREFRYQLNDISDNPEFWMNFRCARYYEVNSIRILSKEEIQDLDNK